MRYFLQRFLQLLLVFFIVTFTVLVVMRVGSPDAKTLAIKLAGKPLTDAEQNDLISRYSLDSNFFTQYFTWLKQLIFHFDLGVSPQNSSTVADLLKPRVWTTVLLGLYAIVFGLLVAVPIAVWQAYRRDRPFDKFASVATFVAVGIPGIVLGLFLKLGFVVHWSIFPSIGDKVYPWDDLGKHFKNFFLPTVTLMIPVAAIYARLLRADMVMTLQSDFVTLASAKGVPPQRVLWKQPCATRCSRCSPPWAPNSEPSSVAQCSSSRSSTSTASAPNWWCRCSRPTSSPCRASSRSSCSSS